MKRTLVRYKTTPERVEENKRLIEQVFQELRAKGPNGVRYLVLALGDGTFVHIVETENDASPITGLGAFGAFQAGIKDRCLEPPQSGEATIVGNYRMINA